MRPSTRKIKKWRKNKPMSHRSFAEKRGRQEKHLKEEVRNAGGSTNES